jgi:ATP-dependent protease ClpP protease subunit
MKKITMNGVIGVDVRSSDIIKQIEDAGTEDKVFEIHSPGGSVMEGLAIYNAIRQSQGRTTMRVLGLAASMATVIAMAKGKPEVAKRSIFMIHNAQMFAMGDYQVLQKAADLSNRVSDMLASIYAENSKKSKKSIREMMDNETYMFGENIKSEGFASSVYDDGKEEKEADAVALAQLEMEECMNKMKGFKEDFKIVAQIIDCIQPPTPPDKPKDEQHPAINAGNNILQEESKMTLQEFIAQNPSAKIEYDKALEDKYNAGKDVGKKEVQDKVNAIAPFLKSDSPYKSGIKDLAVDVLEGKRSEDALHAAIALFDKDAEARKSLEAQNESQNQGDIQNQQDNNQPTTQDGVIKNDADFAAEIKRSKEMLGQEVK